MNRPRRDLQLLGVTVDRADGGAHEARAELWRRGSTETSGEKYVGTASEREPRHAVANAVLVALRRAYTGSRADRLELVSVDVIEALGGVSIVGVAVSAEHRGHGRLLFGFCRVVAYDAAQATARAVLDATNRLLAQR